MKRILLSAVLAFALPLYAAAEAPTAGMNSEHRTICVTGNVDMSLYGKDVIVMASETDIVSGAEDICFIGSDEVDDNGSYSVKFSVKDAVSLDNLKIKVNQSMTDITETVTAVESTMLINIDAKYSRADEKMTVYVNNLYDNANEFTLITASYNQDGVLLSAHMENKNYSYDEAEQSISVDYSMPESAVYYKVFAFVKDTIQPLSWNHTGYEIDYSEFADRYTDEEIKETADALFSNLKADDTRTRAIYNAYKGGDYKMSLILYRDYMVDCFRNIRYDKDSVPQTSSYTGEYYYGTADVLTGKISLEDFNAKFAGNASYQQYVDYENALSYIDSEQPSALNWKFKKESGVNSLVTNDNLRHSFLRLAIRYSQTGDEAYLKKLLQFMEDYSLNFKNQVHEYFEIEDLSYKEIGMNTNSYDTDVYAYNNVGSFASNYLVARCQKLDSILYSLIIACKSLPQEGGHDYATTYFNNGLTEPMTSKLEKDAQKLIDPVRLARFMTHMYDTEMPTLAHSVLNKTGGTANIIASSYLNSIKLSSMFEGFVREDEVMDTLVEKSNAYFENILLKDGGCTETSINYNVVTINAIRSTNYFINTFKSKLSVESFADMTNKWDRLMEGYSSPLGLTPNIGNVYNNYGTIAYWKNESAKQELEESIKSQEYTSVYYPYSGYGALRDDWSADSLYMSFFTSPNRRQGHKFVGTNAIMNVSAYGRTLLLCGGVPWYGKDYVPNYKYFLENGYDEINGYFGENSSRKASTVMVNGKSQADNEYQFGADGKAMNTINSSAKITSPLDARWGTNTHFDFAEGTYDGAYSVFDTESALKPDVTVTEGITKEASHNRQMIFAKDAGMWVVVDTLKNNTENVNTYEAMWHFPAFLKGNKKLTGFADNQIIQNGNKIYTADTEGPNVYLYSYSDRLLSYDRYYGEYEKGKTSFGWSNGGSDVGTGKYTPRTEFHVKWTDDGGREKTQLVTVIAPSEDTSEPIIKTENKSDTLRGINAYTLTKADGTKLTFSISTRCHSVDVSGNSVDAKSVIFTESASGVCGVVIDCERINSENKKGSYMFSINNGELVIEDEIAVPESFGYTEIENGYIPVYKN